MSAAALPDITAIDAAVAKGEWWLRLFDELSNRGRRRSEAVRDGKGRWPTFGDLARIAHAVCLAVVAAIRLRGYLKDLARLRALAPDELVARQAPRDTATPNAAPAPQPDILAPWKFAPPRVLPLVAEDPSGQAASAFDTAHPLASAIAPNARPWRPPRPG